MSTALEMAGAQDASVPLVARLEAARERTVETGELVRAGLVAKWHADAMVVALARQPALRIDATAAVQLSRWREAGAASLWASLRGVRAPSRELLCAELRDRAGTRLTLVAPCDTAETRALLEGLPWLAVREAIVLEAAQLVSLLEVACAHGAQLARWDAGGVGEAPELGAERPLTPMRAAGVLLGHTYAYFGLFWLLLSGPMATGALAKAVVGLDGAMLLAAFFTAAFAMIGVVLLVLGVQQGRLALSLLRRGRITTGELRERRKTNVEINDVPVEALHFAFRSADGREHVTVFKTAATKRLLDEARERIIYDEADPGRALPVDGLPGSLGLDDHGRITGRAPVLPVFLAIAALAASLLAIGVAF